MIAFKIYINGICGGVVGGANLFNLCTAFELSALRSLPGDSTPYLLTVTVDGKASSNGTDCDYRSYWKPFCVGISERVGIEVIECEPTILIGLTPSEYLVTKRVGLERSSTSEHVELKVFKNGDLISTLNAKDANSAHILISGYGYLGDSSEPIYELMPESLGELEPGTCALALNAIIDTGDENTSTAEVYQLAIGEFVEITAALAES